MKVKWLGHSAFLVTARDGTKVITDPFAAGSYDGAVRYRPIRESADIVLVSHEHPDHNDAGQVDGSPRVVRDPKPQTIKGVAISGMGCYHDDSKGAERGRNTIFSMEVDGVRVCHLGDLGHDLDDAAVRKLGAVDVLFVPVGGHFTIDAQAATRLIDRIKPRVAIPMHYKTRVLDFPVAPVDDFLEGKKNVRRRGVSEVELTRETLPATTEIWVLEHTC